MFHHPSSRFTRCQETPKLPCDTPSKAGPNKAPAVNIAAPWGTKSWCSNKNKWQQKKHENQWALGNHVYRNVNINMILIEHDLCGFWSQYLSRSSLLAFNWFIFDDFFPRDRPHVKAMLRAHLDVRTSVSPDTFQWASVLCGHSARNPKRNWTKSAWILADSSK